MSHSSKDIHFMRHALALARRGLGRTAPNPSVGCVLVKNDKVVGRGRTADGGRPHAEVVALKRAGFDAKGSTAYVSLEPCSHHGETPPCTGALIESGVSRVVVACQDPDPRVSGQGIRQLYCAGIAVETGILEEDALMLNKGFLLKTTQGRPLVTLKVATGSDGRILPGKEGKIRWVTGTLARHRAHLERSFHDAILVGSGTVLGDNPALTTRLPGFEHDLIRVVLDRSLRVSPEALFLQPLDLPEGAVRSPPFLFHGPRAEGLGKFSFLAGEGRVRLIEGDPHDLTFVLKTLADSGVTRLLVEGGPHIHGSFLRAGYCDRLLWFRGSAETGDSGRPAFDGFDLPDVLDRFEGAHKKTIRLGDDSLEVYEKEA